MTTGYTWEGHWLYLYLVTVVTHIGYLFYYRVQTFQDNFASTVLLGDGNALPTIALPTRTLTVRKCPSDSTQWKLSECPYAGRRRGEESSSETDTAADVVFATGRRIESETNGRTAAGNNSHQVAIVMVQQ